MSEGKKMVREAEGLFKQARSLESCLFDATCEYHANTRKYVRAVRVWHRAVDRRKRRFANYVCASLNRNGNIF